MNIVFENENLIAVDKPHGWLTTPARSADDPRPCLGRELQAAVGSQVYPVHRLDFEVGGLVLFARTAQAHRVAQ
ncbi:MAG TPA: pseudouridine synthase, partial [Bdellovibrionales bacterium]|nr:pseudouridine synthase [Bdellovibrionales bacterium]